VKYAALRCPNIAMALVVAILPAVGHAAAWTVVPSVESTLTFADNITTQSKGNEESEIVLEVMPAVRVASSEGRTQLGLNYGIDNLYYANDPHRNLSQQSLRSNASSEMLRDLFFVNASGTITYQAIKPTAAVNVGTLAISRDSTEVATWNLSPYFQQTMGGDLMMRAGLNLTAVDYKEFLPDSFTREYFVNMSSGPSAQDLIWKFDVKADETYNAGQLSDSTHRSAELDFRYRVLPQWALAGRAGYVDYTYDYDSTVSDEPKGKTWRTGAVWIPSTRTELELGASKHFFGRTKYGSFFHRGQSLHVDVNYEEIVTYRRQLQTEFSKLQAADPEAQIGPRFLTETEEVFVSKNTRVGGGYKTSELAIELFGYHNRRRTQKTAGTEIIEGAEAKIGLIFSRRASLEASISQARMDSLNLTSTAVTQASLSLLRTFGTGLHGSIILRRNAQNSTDTLLSDYVAYFVSMRVLMEF